MSKKSIVMVAWNSRKIAICILLPLIMLWLAVPVQAQYQTVDVTKAIEENAEWSEGTVFLKNGDQLNGLIRLNTKMGLLAYESGEVSKTFNPRTVIGFEFFDAVQIKKRSFISLEYENPKPPKSNPFSTEKATQLAAKVPQFFEVLMEFPSFALLSTFGQVQIESMSSYPVNQPGAIVPANSAFSSTSYSQVETIFVMDPDGTLLPLLQITNKEVLWLIDTKKTKAKNIDEDNVLATFTAPHFGELQKYAKENKLTFKKKDDLLKILEYYKTLVGN